MMEIVNMPCHIYENLLIDRIASVIEKTRCECIALSGGIDTSLIAAISVNVVRHIPKAIVAYYKNGIPRDLVYALYIANVLGLDIEFVEIDDRYIAKVLPMIIEIARKGGHEDYIEIRNDVVFYTILEKAKNRCRCIYTGSGGDEVFSGYSFMYEQLMENEIDEKRRVWAYGRYPEKEIANILNVNIVTPYLDQKVLELALTIPIKCLRSTILRGKEILRNILEGMGLYIVAYRVKTPAEAGAGTDIIDSNYLNRITSHYLRTTSLNT